MIELFENHSVDYQELAWELGSFYGIVFDEEHRATMLKECKTMDPTKPSYQRNSEIMGIDISQASRTEDDSKQSPLEDDSKLPAKSM